jgi:hypothetical protein
METFKNMPLVELLILILGVVGLLWYYVCLVSVGLKPNPAGGPVGAYRQFESLSITTISVSLATFIGSLLGTTQAAHQLESQPQVPTPSPVSGVVQSTLRASDLQWACAGFYVISLALAIFFWHREKDRTDPAISTLAKSLLGVVGGALSIALKPD